MVCIALHLGLNPPEENISINIHVHISTAIRLGFYTHLLQISLLKIEIYLYFKVKSDISIWNTGVSN